LNTKHKYFLESTDVRFNFSLQVTLNLEDGSKNSLLDPKFNQRAVVAFFALLTFCI